MDEQKNIISEFAIASLALAVISFINLAGIEKAILAIVFGTLALKRMEKNGNLSGVKFARAGIILGALSIAVTIHFMVKFYPTFKQIINKMQSEGAMLEGGAGSMGSQQPESIPGTKLF